MSAKGFFTLGKCCENKSVGKWLAVKLTKLRGQVYYKMVKMIGLDKEMQPLHAWYVGSYHPVSALFAYREKLLCRIKLSDTHLHRAG